MKLQTEILRSRTNKTFGDVGDAKKRNKKREETRLWTCSFSQSATWIAQPRSCTAGSILFIARLLRRRRRRAYLSAARRVERIINEQERLVYPHVVDIFRHVTRAVFSSILPPPSFPTTSQLYYTYRSLSRRPRQAPVCTCGCSVLHILVKHAVT